MEIWVLLALLSAVIFALKDVVTKSFFSKYDISPSQILFETYFFGFVVLLLFAFPSIAFFSFYEYWYLFILKAVALATSTILYFSLLQKHDVSIVSPLLNASPLVLLILSAIFLGEIITFFQFIGIIIILISVYVLEIHTTHYHRKSPHHFHITSLLKKPSVFFVKVFVMLLSFSITAIADKMILNEGVSVITTMYFTFLLIFIIFSVYFVKISEFILRLKHIVKQPHTLIIAGIGLVDTAVILSAIAHPMALVSIVIPLRRTSTLLSSLFGGMLFHETHLKRKLIATAVMIIGVIFIVG